MPLTEIKTSIHASLIKRVMFYVDVLALVMAGPSTCFIQPEVWNIKFNILSLHTAQKYAIVFAVSVFN